MKEKGLCWPIVRLDQFHMRGWSGGDWNAFLSEIVSVPKVVLSHEEAAREVGRLNRLHPEGEIEYACQVEPSVFAPTSCAPLAALVEIVPGPVGSLPRAASIRILEVVAITGDRKLRVPFTVADTPSGAFVVLLPTRCRRSKAGDSA